jgi:hypothetical protein
MGGNGLKADIRASATNRSPDGLQREDWSRKDGFSATTIVIGLLALLPALTACNRSYTGRPDLRSHMTAGILPGAQLV